MGELVNITDAQIAKMRNLRPYRNKTDDEIRESILRRQSKPKPKKTKTVSKDPNSTQYDIKFNEKLRILRDEYAVDMNTADQEGLRALVNLELQLDMVNDSITELTKEGKLTAFEADNLKKLGDFQRSVINSITDLQDKLGITRKQRKEKKTDDIPQWIDGVLHKAQSFYDRKTIKIECPKCVIELSRVWLNFPNEKNDIEMSLTCWKCKEVVLFTG